MNRATCRDCGKKITVTKAGTLREHGHPANRCPGGGEKPTPAPVPWSEQARREPPPLPITARPDLSTFHVFDDALHHCPDPDDAFGHVVEFIDGSDSLARLVELATAHTCEDNDE